MQQVDTAAVPDGLVMIPRAGAFSPEQLMQQQQLVNSKRAIEWASGQVQNLTLHSGVDRVARTVGGILDDWNNGADRSLKRLVVSDNRLQGLGLLMVVLALGGLLIDAVLKGPGQ